MKNIRIPLLSQFPYFTPESGFRFEIATSATMAAGRSDSFVSLSEGGLSSRVLLARIGLPGGEPISWVAVKIRRNAYRVAHSPGQRAQVTNRIIDEQWEFERNSLLARQPCIGGLHPAFTSWAERGQFPPILFCSASQQYFHPPSPYSGRPLSVCRDDALLQSVGLRPYSESTSRYLYCPIQAESQKSDPFGVIFWSHAKTPEEPTPARVKVHRGEQLYSDVWPVIESLIAGDSKELTESARGSCFGPDFRFGDLKRDRLVILSYYDTEILPLSVAELNYDEVCMMLGGSDWEDLWRGGGATALVEGRTKVIEGAKRATGYGRQFYYADDDSGLFPLECLLLKLAHFRELCLRVEALHSRLHRPHLDLSPAHAVSSLKCAGMMPKRWGFDLSLVDLGSASALPEAGDAGCPDAVFRPPLDPDSVYSAPFMRDEVFGKSELSHLIISTAELITDADGKTRGRLELDLMAATLRARKMSMRDVLLISLPPPAHDLASLVLYANVREHVEGGIRCLATTPPVDKAVFAAIEAMTNRVIYDREVIYYRAFAYPCDIYSLGMLLFRTLLVHDGQDILAIAESLKYVTGKIELTAPRGESPHPRQVEIMFREHIRGDARTFNRYSVLHSRDKRAANRNSIPEDVWEELLVLGFRMASFFKRFSICEDNGDFDPADPGAKVKLVRERIDATVDRLWSELFGSQKMNREILEVLDAALESLEVKGA